MNKPVLLKDGILAAKGYQAVGVSAGIKVPGRKDFALLLSETTANAAALFTTSAVAAAPVRLGRERLAGGRIRAIAVNTGYANACTGATGMTDARAMSRMVSEALDIPDSEVLVSSTGVIGRTLPMDRIAEGVRLAVATLPNSDAEAAAQAIMTTDTVHKQAAVAFEVAGKTITIGAMCKGSGMIEPYMATMLAFLASDADIAPADLKSALQIATDKTFNRIVIDNDRSTNDTVVLLANGAAGAPTLTPSHPAWPLFQEALTMLCTELARQMVLDGEGATKFVAVNVSGARSDDDAHLAARAIARSMLVKTSWFGLDPNWGRVIAAAGYSGAEVVEEQTQIRYNGIHAFNRGEVADAPTRDRLKEVLRLPEFDLDVDLGLGDGRATIFTCDLSDDYITINAKYTT